MLTTVLFICPTPTVIYAITVKYPWEACRMISAWKITLLADTSNRNVFHQPGFWENMGRHFLYSWLSFKLERHDKTTRTTFEYFIFTLKCIVYHYNSPFCITVTATNVLPPLKFKKRELKICLVFFSLSHHLQSTVLARISMHFPGSLTPWSSKH